jgi:hypothetical protein
MFEIIGYIAIGIWIAWVTLCIFTHGYKFRQIGLAIKECLAELDKEEIKK